MNEISLAALTVLDAGPVGQIEAAAEAGFDSVGLRLAPLLPRDAVTIGDRAAERAVAERLSGTGLGVLEIGVVTITEALDIAGLGPLLDYSARIGARYLVCPVADREEQRRADAFARLCAAAAPRGLVPLIEFNPYSACTTLGQAVSVVEASGAVNAGLCIDAFHLSRSGGHPDDLTGIDPRLLRLLHFCDAAPLPAGALGEDAVRAESRGGRLLPGEGALWLGDLLAALPPDIPVSVEAPSAALAGLPAAERARMALAATRAVLARRAPG